MPSLQSIEMDRQTPSMCYAGGKVKLPSLWTPPEPLKSLLSGQHPRSKEFLTNARKYNSCFQMTCLAARMSTMLAPEDGCQHFGLQARCTTRSAQCNLLLAKRHSFSRFTSWEITSSNPACDAPSNRDSTRS